MVPGLRRNLSCSAACVSIGAWQRCVESKPDVVHVQPLLNADGSSRKSVVDPKVIQNGGGHMCPHELEVYIGKTTKKTRVVAGLTRRGGILHVYFREFSEKLHTKIVKELFYGAASMLEGDATRSSIPPAPTRQAPTPAPAKQTAIPPPPARPVPPVTDKLITPLPHPLAYDLTVECSFDATNFGQEYLSLQRGQKLRLLPFAEDGEGWWYGEVAITDLRGWFLPSFVSE